MEERIRKIVADMGLLACPVETLSADDDLFDAGLTSYGSVQLMLAIEDAFDIEFPESRLTRKTFATFASMAHAVRDLTNETV